MIGTLGRLSPQRRRFYVAIIAMIVIAVALPVGRSLLTRDPEPVSAEQRVLGPVLLIPGYGGSTDSLEFLASYLRDLGREVSIVSPVGDGTGDLREQAASLRSAVRRALRRAPAASVDLVDCDLLRVLNDGDETPDGPRWVSIWTEDDQTVVPPTSGSLDGALDYAVQDVCPDAVVGHGELPRTAVTILMVTAALGVPLPSLPGAEVCAAELSFAG